MVATILGAEAVGKKKKVAGKLDKCVETVLDLQQLPFTTRIG
jgi:hypothetical protein